MSLLLLRVLRERRDKIGCFEDGRDGMRVKPELCRLLSSEG